MRMRKKKNLLPRMERCGAYQIKDPYERKGRWHDLMPEAKEIRVELGCGKGRFTVETAAAEPARRRQSCTTSSSSTSTPTSCPKFSMQARSTASMSTSATRGRPSGRPSAG